MKKILGLGLLCVGFAYAEYVSAPIMAHLPDDANYTDGAYAYAPATVYYDGVFHQFYCSRGGYTDHFFYHPDDDKGQRVIINPQDDKYKGKPLPPKVDGIKIDDSGYRKEHGLIRSWDHIRYRTSKNGTTWSPARIVMTQTKYEYKNKQNCACDPAIIHGDDGYWYLYYQGSRDIYGGTVYVARSESIGGPYLTITNEKKNGEYVATRWPSKPKEVIQSEIKPPDGLSNYGAGQLSVVKGGIDSKYHFWMVEHFWTKANGTDLERMYIKHGTSDNPIDLPKIKKWKKITMDADAAKDYVFTSNDSSYKIVDFGEVRFNTSSKRYEMWLLSNALGETKRNTYFHKFSSKDGTKWTRETTKKDNPYGGPYYDVNNLGVSGTKDGWITNRYLLSFGGPSKGLKKGPSDFTPTNSKEYASQPWAIWEMIIGDWQTSSMKISYGLTFPEEPQNYKYGNFTKNLEYITGDFDGDGVTDLAAVDKKTKKCYIRSSQTGQKGVQGIPWGDTLKNMTENHTIVTGDYDGDGKTDIALVNRAKGLWTIISSGTGKLIRNNWLWNYMTSSHTVISGDYDGDGKTDRAIVNTSKGTWWIISSRTGKALEPDNENHIKTPDGKKIWEWEFPNWSKDNSRILVGDYDNDGITDIAMVNVSTGQWYVYSSQTGKKQYNFMTAGDYWGKKLNELSSQSFGKLSKSSIITMGDYNGDGAADRGYVNWNEGKWYHLGLNPIKEMESLNGWNKMKKDMAKVSHYKILEGDYDGDGATDHAFVDLDTRKVYIYSSIRGTSGINWDIKHVYSFSNKAFLARKASEEGDINMNITPSNNAARISVNGSKLVIQDAKNGDKISIMDAQGRMLHNMVATGSEMDMHLPSSGMYIVRIGSKVHRVSIK